jgi:PAS domain S-box-containing protein
VTVYLQKDTSTEQFELLANRITNVVSKARSEQQLAAERQRFQLLFDRLTQPTIEVEYRGDDPIVLQVNSAFEETFGYDAGEIVGESLDEFIVPEEFQEEAVHINDRVRGGAPLHSESVTRMTVDGRREFLLQNAAYENGSGGFAIYTDVTERERRQRRLKQSLDLLEHTERLTSSGGWELDLESGAVH